MTIEIPDYLSDHTFMGRPVLPATEGIEMLAAAAYGRFPAIDLSLLLHIRFDRFLHVPSDRRPVAADARFECHQSGEVTAVLTTRTRPKRTAMTRELRHLTLTIPGRETAGEWVRPERVDLPKTDPDIEIDPLHLYRDLVPFGPAFQNIIAPLYLWPQCAVAAVTGGQGDSAAPARLLGSPFPLDAAFHAACVWGQRYAGIVAFPVSLERRAVFLPTRSGEAYTALVMPLGPGDGGLLFDLLLYDACRRPCEFVSGLVMKDVSGGRLRPPSWITV